VRIAARPGRFGMVWGTGNAPLQLHFAIVCP